MTLDDAQRKKVGEWIAGGLKLSEIQTRMASELGIRMTYMDVRLLVDDLKLTPKDIEKPKVAAPVLPAPEAPGPAQSKTGVSEQPAPAAAGAGKVSVAVDALARPGAMVSGKATFSDGKTADWYIDQTGRLGVVPKEAGYRPPAADMPQFQAALEAELSRMGF